MKHSSLWALLKKPGVGHHYDSLLKSLLVDGHFQTCFVIGWQLAASQSEAMLENQY